MVVLGSKQGGTLKLVNLKLAGWASIQLLTLSLTFLVCFAEMSSHFSIKTNKRKVRKCPKYMVEFSVRFDLANGKCLSNFLGIFCKYRTLHRDCYLTSRKRKKKFFERLYWVVFNFPNKNIIHDKVILFDAAFLAQKKTQCRQVTLNELLNNYGFS